MTYDWQADVKAGGGAVSIIFEDGEWTATGDEAMASMILTTFEANLDALIDAETVNPVITGKMPDLYEKSLRSVPGVRVYGIDDRTDDDPSGAVI